MSSNPNTNCLAGMKCPQCGHTESFRIAADCVFLFTDEGTDMTPLSELDWDCESYCECPACACNGPASKFMEQKDGET